MREAPVLRHVVGCYDLFLLVPICAAASVPMFFVQNCRRHDVPGIPFGATFAINVEFRKAILGSLATIRRPISLTTSPVSCMPSLRVSKSRSRMVSGS